MTLIERINSFINEVASDIKSLYANKVNKTDVIAVAQGGTGATDAETARANLDVLSSNDVLDYILGYNYVSLNYIINKLFNNSEQGVVFDFNDLSTMFQDAAGTIPVTGVGQPVGKVLDKSGRGNHATQTTSAKRPILQKNATTGAYYLQFDGVDDFLVTNSIDLSVINKISMFSCIKKVTDVDALIFETSANFNSNGANGAVSHSQTASKSIGFAARTNAYATVDCVDEPAPQQAVYSSVIDLALTSRQGIYFRKNGMSQTVTRYEQGDATGNLGNYPLYIGMRGGASVPFSGQIYSMIIISRLTTDLELKNTERAMAKSIGVAL